MSLATRSDIAARRSCGVISSCPAVWGDSLQDLSTPLGGAEGGLRASDRHRSSSVVYRSHERSPNARIAAYPPRCSELDLDLAFQRPQTDAFSDLSGVAAAVVMGGSR